MSTPFSIPVTLPESWGGFATNQGLLRLESQALVIEFETKDGFLEVWRSGIQKVALPLSAVGSFTWKRGWFGGTIELTFTSLELMKDLPASEPGRIRLKVARRDLRAAEQLVNEIHLAQASEVARPTP